MKKLISILLVALMLLPFGVFANAAAPAEPTLQKTDVVGYIAHGKTGVAPSDAKNDGLTPETSKPSWGIDYDGILKVVQMGGTIVSTGKAYVGSGLNFDNLGPVVMTAVDPKTNTDYRNDDYTGTQKGSFINKADITISGDLIFDKIYILTRTEGQGEFHVVNGANLVIRDTVDFVDMKADDSIKPPVLNLEKNGTAFLHAVGFSDYIGTGTIVLDKKLVDESKIALDAFANFKGIVLDETGAVIYSGNANAADTTVADTNANTKAPETTKAPDTTKSPSTTKTPDTTKAPETTTVDNDSAEEGSNSPIIWIAAGVVAAAAIAVVVVVVIKKKKAE